MAISKSSSKNRVKKSFSSSPPAVDKALIEFREPFEGDLLEGVNEQTCQDDIVRDHIASLSLEMADVLVREPLTIESLQGQNFKFRGIWRSIPLREIRSRHSRFLEVVPASMDSKRLSNTCGVPKSEVL